MLTGSRHFRRFGLGRFFALAVLASFIALRIWDPTPVEAIRHRAFDVYQIVQPRVPSQQFVTIVDIDEASLKALGQWPWPRSVMADLVSRITDLGAVAIGFDILFPEPDRSSPTIAVEAFRGIDEPTKDRIRELPDNDALFADAIGKAPVVLGQSGYRIASVDAGTRPSGDTRIATMGADPAPYLVRFPQRLNNLPILERAARGSGMFSIIPEGDGTVRRIPLVAMAGGITLPSLSLELIRVLTQSGAILIRSDSSGIRSVGVPGLDIPTDGKGRIWLHFAPVDENRYVSAIDVLNGRVPRDRVAGRVVLVGTSATGLLDLKITPTHPAVPGVEIHAQLLESAVTHATLSRPGYTAFLELGIAALIGLALIMLAPKVGAWALFIIGGFIAALTVGLSWYFFAHLSVLIDATFPLIASLSVYSVLVCTNYLTVTADRHRIRSAFSQYISPALVEQLAQSPEKLTLGGEQRDLTVLFSDIRGFTAIAESYKDDPQGLTALINRVFTPFTRNIIDRRGTIDKYMGDAIMAFWNAPLDDEAHEVNACEAALDMLDSLARINHERARAPETHSLPALRIGIGLNTGSCVVGNFGSDLHFNYSVLGDTVNLSSRLEGLSKHYGVPIIIGSRTAEAAGAQFAVLELDCLQVLGKSDPEHIFTILGRADTAGSPEFRELAAMHRDLLDHYRMRKWTRALEMILLCREAGRSFGLERVYEIYTDRIRGLIAAPPSAHWNGVAVVDHK